MKREHLLPSCAVMLWRDHVELSGYAAAGSCRRATHRGGGEHLAQLSAAQDAHRRHVGILPSVGRARRSPFPPCGQLLLVPPAAGMQGCCDTGFEEAAGCASEVDDNQTTTNGHIMLMQGHVHTWAPPNVPQVLPRSRGAHARRLRRPRRAAKAAVFVAITSRTGPAAARAPDLQRLAADRYCVKPATPHKQGSADHLLPQQPLACQCQSPIQIRAKDGRTVDLGEELRVGRFKFALGAAQTVLSGHEE